MLDKPTLAELAEKTLRLGLEISAARELPGPERLREELGRAVARFENAAVEAGHGGRAVELASAGLRAYVDEKARRRLGRGTPGGEPRGKEFFSLLEETGRDDSLLQARQVLLLCLVFGFEGDGADGEDPAEDELICEADALWRARSLRRE